MMDDPTAIKVAIDKLNIANCQVCCTAFETFKKGLEGRQDGVEGKGEEGGELREGEGETVSVEEWKTVIEEEGDKVVQMISEKMQETAGSVKELIPGLAPEARGAAVGVWINGVNITMNAISILFSQIKEIGDKSLDFSKTNLFDFDRIFSLIHKSSSSAITAIKTSFYPSTTETSNDSSSITDKGIFTGKHTWPAGTAEHVALQEYSAITSRLISYGLRITGSSFRVGNSGEAINGTISFELIKGNGKNGKDGKDGKSREETGKDLEAFWDSAISHQKKLSGRRVGNNIFGGRAFSVAF